MQLNVTWKQRVGYGIVGVGALTVLFQLVGFSANGWLVISVSKGDGSETGAFNDGKESEHKKVDTDPIPDQPNVPIDDGGVPIPEPGRPNIPIDDGGVPIPIPEPGGPNVPIDDGGVPIPEPGRPNVPIDEGGVPIPKPGRPNVPIDDGGVPIPEPGRPNVPIDEGGVPIPEPGRPNVPIDDGWRPIPELGRPNFPIDDGGRHIPEPGLPNVPIDDGGVPIPEPGRPNVPIDDGGRPIHEPGRPNVPIDDGGRPIPEPGRPNVPIDDGGRHIPEPGRPNVPIDDGGLLMPEPDMGPKPGRPNLPIDDGGLPIPEPENGLAMPGRPKILIDDGGRDIPETGNSPKSGEPPKSKLGKVPIPFQESKRRSQIEKKTIFGNIPKQDVNDPSSLTKALPPMTRSTTVRSSTQNTDMQTSTDRLTGSFKPIPRFKMTTMSSQTSKPMAKDLGDSYWTLHMGMWGVRLCAEGSASDNECFAVSSSIGFQMIHLKTNKDMSGDIGEVAMWNDLRVETVLGVLAGIVGLVSAFLSVRPILCLKQTYRATAIVGVCAFVLSSILFIIPIARIGSISSSLQASFVRINRAFVVETPWAVVISGIGVGLALITAGMLAALRWAEERGKFGKPAGDASVAYNNRDATESTPTEDDKGFTNAIYDTPSDTTQADTENSHVNTDHINIDVNDRGAEL